VTIDIGGETRNVTGVELEHGISAGIHLRSLGKGMVSVFEEQDVRIESKMNLSEWDELPYMERVILVAMARTKRAMSNLQSEAEIRESDRKANKGRK
jgi:hypothetical protein